MTIELKTSIAGFYKFEAMDSDGNIRILADTFPNLITDTGLDTIANSNNYLTYCRVGSGNTVPSNSDAQLVYQLASTSSVNSNTDTLSSSSPYYIKKVKVFQFPIGSISGNVLEVGIGSSATGNTLFSRALVLDRSGNPATITVLPTESLLVTYTLFFYHPLSDITGSITLNSISYAYTSRASYVADASYNGMLPSNGESYVITSNKYAYSTGIGSITSGPTGTQYQASSMSVAAYVSGNYYVDHTISWDVSSGNASGGIGSILLVKLGTISFQIGFTPSIPKTTSNVFTITVRHSWGRA